MRQEEATLKRMQESSLEKIIPHWGVLFINALHDLHAAELHLTNVIPGILTAVTNAALQDEFEKHLKQTKLHVNRLEQIF